jgi:hypothetical protein
MSSIAIYVPIFSFFILRNIFDQKVYFKKYDKSRYDKLF